MAAQTSWAPEPPQVRAKEGLIDLPGVRLWYWDTGGEGEAVILLHPDTGSSASWGYQQPVFANAGYRVIGYSRRGHYRSEPGAADQPGTAAGDLNALSDALGIQRFHLIGLAAGGFIVPDYALSYPGRLYSMVIACSLGGVDDPEFAKITSTLTFKGFNELPPEFREIGPSYRAANPEGVRRWKELESTSRTGERVRQPPMNTLSWANIASVKTPTLLLTGDADLFMPPSRLREWSNHLPGSEMGVIAEAGHSAYWEQPEAFNIAVLTFLRKNRA